MFETPRTSCKEVAMVQQCLAMARGALTMVTHSEWKASMATGTHG